MKDQTFKLDLQLFADEEPTQPEEIVNPDNNAIEALKKLKENSVPKEVYKRLEEQNRQLLDSIINGDSFSQEVVDEKRPEFKDLVLKLSNTSNEPLNNLEFWKTALEFRKQAMEQGYPDPATPHGRKVEASPLDEASVTKQLGIIEECIKEAGDDPVIFNNELRRRGLK